MPLILSGNVASAIGGGYEVANSCRFDDGSSDYLNQNSISSGSRTTWTFSCWVKLSKISSGSINIFSTNNGSDFSTIYLTNNKLTYYDYSGGGNVNDLQTNTIFRDLSAYYNFVIRYDSTESTESDRIRFYVNGVQQTSFASSSYPSSSYDSFMNVSGYNQYIGAQDGTGDYFDGYMSEVCFIDGQSLAPTSFGEFDEDSPTIWKPINVSGLTFGTNGFYLDFEDSDNLGDDESGNTADFTEANLAAVDQASDSPTNNFATFNPLYKFGGSDTVLAEGNLQIFDHDWGSGISTIGATNGKWYMEMKCISSTGGADNFCTGIVALDGASDQLIADTLVGGSGSSVITYAYQNGGEKGIKNTWTAYGDTYTAGDIIGVYMDLDNNKLYFAKNGTVQDSGTGITIDDGYTYALVASVYYGTVEGNYGNPTYTGTDKSDKNGYGSFEYDPSVGTFDSASKDFYALCTKNLAEFG